MPFDGFVSDWEPKPEKHPLWGCYTVCPMNGPRGGKGPYKGRYLVEVLYDDWVELCCIVVKSKAQAYFRASHAVRASKP